MTSCMRRRRAAEYRRGWLGAWVAVAAFASVLATAGAHAQSSEEPSNSSGGLFERSLTQASAPPAAGGDSGPNLTWGGYVRADAFVGKVPGFATGVLKAGYGELSTTLRARSGRRGAAFAELRLRNGQQGDEVGLITDLREAYVDLHLGPVDLRAGHQIIVWGRADAFNPTNNLTPVDVRVRSPVEDDRRVANFALTARYHFAPFHLEAAWLPVYRPSELPGIEPIEGVAIVAPDFPDPELAAGLLAARLHLDLPGVESSVSLLRGPAPLPGFALSDFQVGAEAEVRVRRSSYEQLVAGADFSTTLGDAAGLRGELAYRRPFDHAQLVQAARPDLQLVVGVDATLSGIGVIAQYLGRYVFDWQRELGPEGERSPAVLRQFEPPLSALVTEQITATIEEELSRRNQIVFAQTARFQHAASVRAHYTGLGDALTASALALVNFTTREWLLFPKLLYRIDDQLHVTLGAELYAGPDGTLLGIADEVLSAGYAELRFLF